jgi:hypothetical protein
MNMFVLATGLWDALPLPPPDPLGYPVPVELLRALSYLTLTLHFVALHFTLGGVMLWLWLRLRRPAHADGMSAYLGSGLTLGFSYLVTLGIPPLLFVQVMYGQLFYSSSVIIGAHWILVVPLLIVAYGLFYLHKLTRERHPAPQWVYMLLALLAMLTIGFFYVNNLTLMQAPERWMSIYHLRPNGQSLNLGDPTVLPRWLALLSPAPAVAGLGLILAGTVLRRWQQEDKGLAFQSLGFRSVLVSVAATGAFGAWFVSRIPQDVLTRVVEMPLLVPVSLAGAALLLVTALLAGLASRSRSLAVPIAAIVAAAGSLATLVALRDMLRLAWLRPHFTPDDVPVHAQWAMFFLFAATLVLGLVLVVWLTAVVTGNLARRYREAHS